LFYVYIAGKLFNRREQNTPRAQCFETFNFLNCHIFFGVFSKNSQDLIIKMGVNPTSARFSSKQFISLSLIKIINSFLIFASLPSRNPYLFVFDMFFDN